MKKLLIILSAAFLCSCASLDDREGLSEPKITDRKTGKWVNIHNNNPDLMGVYVQQFPDCQFEAKSYEGKHPVSVTYVFRNGKAHQLSYYPDGRIKYGFWWDVPQDHWIWSQLDCNLPKE